MILPSSCPYAIEFIISITIGRAFDIRRCRCNREENAEIKQTVTQLHR